MGDLPGGSWKSGAVGLVLILAFLVVGIKFGGGPDPKPTKVKLACTVTDGQYSCKEVR